MLSPDKMKSEIKLPGMNTQALEQLGKIFEENVQEVAEGYFSLNPKTKKQRRGYMLHCVVENSGVHMYIRDIKDLLIRDRIICGTCDSSLQEELLRKKHLTLKERIKE